MNDDSFTELDKSRPARFLQRLMPIAVLNTMIFGLCILYKAYFILPLWGLILGFMFSLYTVWYIMHR